jgi:hypothetical protein
MLDLAQPTIYRFTPREEDNAKFSNAPPSSLG